MKADMQVLCSDVKADLRELHSEMQDLNDEENSDGMPDYPFGTSV